MELIHMCGIAGIFGSNWERMQLEAMVNIQHHRGPDHTELYVDPSGLAGLGHNRLSIIDLSSAGNQPMKDRTGHRWIVFNGEIYNYVELKAELCDYPYDSHSDTEVILAAYERWGEQCVEHFLGMFVFLIWDEVAGRLFAARDRFGVKPLYYHVTLDGVLLLASEIKALHAAGVPCAPDQTTWATYLSTGLYDHTARTFWQDIQAIEPGSSLAWTKHRGLSMTRWYDIASRVQRSGPDERSDNEVAEELLSVLEHSVRLRFRSDVPVGICLSGGLDSSLLLGLVQRIQGQNSNVDAYTFYTADPAYDETPWVQLTLAHTQHRWQCCRLAVDDVPLLAAQVQWHEDEPFGGLPTLGMAQVHAAAQRRGVIVLLDGNGIDEGWGGYEYYQRAASVDVRQGPVQGAKSPGLCSDCLRPEFAAQADIFEPKAPLGDPMLNLQYRDVCYAKIPRALRFNDRVSMMYSRELREPFLDHRIIELGLRQPTTRRIRNGQGKYLVRQVAQQLLPGPVYEAPKRPVQTPQREWLRGPLAAWATDQIESGLRGWGYQWLDTDRVRAAWRDYIRQGSDNSFPIWQWISLGLLQQRASV
jgi:asparagine synthase (glutamine-hydrolysing)